MPSLLVPAGQVARTRDLAMCPEIAVALKGIAAVAPVVTLIIAIAAVKIARIRATERTRTMNHGDVKIGR